MNKRFLILVWGILIAVGSYDFVNRIYQPLQVKEIDIDAGAPVNLSIKNKVPDEIKTMLQQWQVLTNEMQIQEIPVTEEFDTGTLGHLRISLLAIYADTIQRTAVLFVEDKNTTEKQLVKLKRNESWSEVTVTELDARIVILELNNETIRLQLFEAQSQRVQG